MMRKLRALVGPEPTLVHAGWLCVLSGLALSLLGVYAIDLSTRSGASGDAPISGRAIGQLVCIPLGMIAAAIVAIPHYRHIKRLAWPGVIVLIGVLAMLLVPVVPRSIVFEQNGARSWITIGSINIQPSEIAKVAYILAMAEYFRFRANHRTIRGLFAPVVITLVPVGLIALQPDLGTASLFVPTLFAILIAAGARLKHLLTAVVLGLVLGPLAYPALRPHQKERIHGMVLALRGEREGADDINHQRFAAQDVAGSGGVTGASPELSRALIRYSTLPERHTDMIFPVVMNRFGLLGGLGVLALYGVWIVGAGMTAGVSRDPFGRLAAIGCAAMLSTQLLTNVAMALGLFPIIGITLPFMSYGRSSMISVWLMTGVVMCVATRQPLPPYRGSFEFGDEEEG